MGQQVKVSRDLVFQGEANYGLGNILGNPSNEKIVWVDDFTGIAIDLTNDYNSTLDGNNDAVAIDNTAGGGGWIECKTGDGAGETSYLATFLRFDISQNPIIEARIKIRDVDGTQVYFGFSDAVTETSPAGTIDYDGGTLTAVATDAVGFVIDADKDSSLIYAASTKSGAGNVVATSTGITWTDNQTKVLRVRLDSVGDAYFYVDGVLKVIHQLAVADVALCLMLNYADRDASADDVDVDYFKSWEDRT